MTTPVTCSCIICNHEKRDEIDKALLIRSFGSKEVTLKSIATTFNVPLRDLQVHALMHIPSENVVSTANEDTESIAGTLKKKEAEILTNLMSESFVTFKNLSGKINSIVSKHTDQNPTIAFLTKPLVDLYLGCGQSIRDTADKIMKMNVMINGDKNDAMSSLAKLVSAIKGVPSDDDDNKNDDFLNDDD